MRTLYSDAFMKNDWMRLFDHILSNDQTWFYYFLVAYLKYFREPLMKLTTIKDFKVILKHNQLCTCDALANQEIFLNSF